jgi:hypothetical protein
MAAERITSEAPLGYSVGVTEPDAREIGKNCSSAAGQERFQTGAHQAPLQNDTLDRANGEECGRSDDRAGDESVGKIEVWEKRRKPDNHEGEERRQRSPQGMRSVELKAQFFGKHRVHPQLGIAGDHFHNALQQVAAKSLACKDL